MWKGIVLQKFCSRKSCHNLAPAPLDLLLGPSKEVRRDLYTPLSREHDEIRLVRVQPGNLDDPVCCVLFCHPLVQSSVPPHDGNPDVSDPARFSVPATDTNETSKPLTWRALSYPWGDSTELVSLTVNGCQVQVTQNLHEALRWLRYHDYEDPIWADALCIDQSNYTERCEQVQLMGSIYGLAAETIVYLPVNRSEELDLASVEHELNLHGIPHEPQDLATKILAWADGTNVSDVTRLLVNCGKWKHTGSYWSRLWTLQECALSRSLHIVSGPLRIPWSVMLDFLNVAIYLWQGLNSTRLGNSVDSGGSSYNNPVYAIMPSGLRTRERLRKKQVTMTLTYLATQMGLEQCADPRDKVYGILAMLEDIKADDGHSILRPDYTLCESCVWQSAVKYEIFATNRLDVLIFCGTRHANQTRFSSTWAPDLSSDAYTAQGWSAYQLSRGEQAQVQIPDAIGGALAVKGFVFGSVGAHKYPMSIPEARGNVPLLEMVRAHFKRLESFISGVTDEPKRQRQCLEDIAVLIRELCQQARPSREETLDLLLTEKNPRDATQQTLASHVLVSLVFYMDISWVNLSDASADEALVSLVNVNETEESDLICGILGCKHPLIVRRGPEGDKIIGQAVVAGYGNGEAIEELRAGKRELETFHFV